MVVPSRASGVRVVVRVSACCALALGSCLSASAVTVTERAKESGCVNKPTRISGEMFKCIMASGLPAYFNVPDAPPPSPSEDAARKSASIPAPAGFPKIDSATQRSRDDVRRKVLGDELATEEKLLAEARTAYAEGAPAALPEERANVEKYRERIAKLRQTVNVHEKNVEALKKELASGK